MNDHNSVRITGWLARDAEMRVSQKGTPWVVLNVDVASGEGDSRRHCWIDCKVFGEQARRFEGAEKGSRVCIMARLVQDSWDDRQTGAKRYKHCLEADAAFLIAEAKAKEPTTPRKQQKLKQPAQAPEEAPDYTNIPF